MTDLKTGKTDLGKGENDVITTIYDLYDLGVRKIVFLWDQSCLGNIKVLVHHCATASVFDRAGHRRADLYSISDTVCSWDSINIFFKSVGERMDDKSVIINEEGGDLKCEVLVKLFFICDYIVSLVDACLGQINNFIV